MEHSTEHRSVQRVVEIAASPETVWAFMVERTKLLAWWGSATEFDARAGGRYRVELASGLTVAGEFVELDPPRRLVYSFGWEGEGELARALPAGASTVEIELEQTAGGTRLRLRHDGLPGPELAASHAGGWEHYLGRLAVAAGGGDAGADPWATVAMEPHGPVSA